MLKREHIKSLEDIAIIFEAVTGSQSRGLSTESSDIDVKGIFLPKPEHLFQLSSPKESITRHNPDIEYHHLRKFIELASLKSNPTILEMLFVDDSFILKKHPIMDILLNEKEQFLTLHAYNSFVCYAREQLMRIKNGHLDTSAEENEIHLKYVLETMLENDELLKQFPSLKKEMLPNISTVRFVDGRLDFVKVSGSFSEINLLEYKSMLSQLEQTVKTYKNIGKRNNKASDERLFKHAAHLVTLLKMGIEILQGKGLNVLRTADRNELLAIRNGAYSFEELYRYSDDLFAEIDSAKKESTLPPHYSREKADDLYRRMMKAYYNF